MVIDFFHSKKNVKIVKKKKDTKQQLATVAAMLLVVMGILFSGSISSFATTTGNEADEAVEDGDG